MKVFRWASFVPAYIILMTVLILILKFVYQLALDTFKIENDRLLFLEIYSVGFFFVFFLSITVSCLVAPKARVRISIIYFVISCLFMVNVIKIQDGKNEYLWYLIFAYLFSILGSFVSILYLKKIIKESLMLFTKTAWGFMLFGLVWLFSSLLLISIDPNGRTDYFSESGFIAILFGIIFLVASLVYESINIRKVSVSGTKKTRFLP